MTTLFNIHLLYLLYFYSHQRLFFFTPTQVVLQYLLEYFLYVQPYLRRRHQLLHRSLSQVLLNRSQRILVVFSITFIPHHYPIRLSTAHLIKQLQPLWNVD